MDHSKDNSDEARALALEYGLTFLEEVPESALDPALVQGLSLIHI